MSNRQLAERAALDCRDAAYRTLNRVKELKSPGEDLIAILEAAEDAITEALTLQYQEKQRLLDMQVAA